MDSEHRKFSYEVFRNFVDIILENEALKKISRNGIKKLAVRAGELIWLAVVFWLMPIFTWGHYVNHNKDEELVYLYATFATVGYPLYWSTVLQTEDEEGK